MCGIVGYTGRRQAAQVLLDGLAKLEYRGYDSVGIAVRDGENETEIVKASGRLNVLLEKTNCGLSVRGCCGIGHTRWATHGEPTEENAHPHCSDDRKVIVVHNGIIENYREIKEKLSKSDYTFYSQTDTEVVAKLIDYYYEKYACSPVEALSRCMARVRGSYALAVMFADRPGVVYAARKDSPMIIGVNENETFLASDVPAILRYTHNVIYIGNEEIAELTASSARFFNIDGEEIAKEPKIIEWNAEAAEKTGYEHYMLKEIHEQPAAIKATLDSVITDSALDLTAVGFSDEKIRELDEIYIAACGSAYHAGVVAQYVIEDLARVPVRVDLASEFRYRQPIFKKNCLLIVISQSGETADTLAALRDAKKQGIETLAIVNVKESSIAREADHVFYTAAGPEISVATTKAYSAQLVAAYALAVQFAKVRGTIDAKRYAELVEELGMLPRKVQKILDDKERVQKFAARYAAATDVFFIGRGIDYAVSLEGSLKMKEISYIHSEAYAAGELKHGTISLVEDGTLIVSVLTQERLYEKTLSNMMEVKSRGAYLLGVTSYGNYTIEDTADFTIYVPKTDAAFAASLAIVPLQMLGYYISVAKGLDVDKPRNLAKSVTVE